MSSYKHGAAVGAKPTPEYRAWRDMRARCYNRNSQRFPNYGARGISICPRWSDFAAFLLDMGERPSPKHSLDRIDNDGPYAPWNCRWATSRQQANNRSTTTFVECEGELLPLSVACDRIGITRFAAYARMKRGRHPITCLPLGISHG
jgi:hypothetical protein